MKSWTAIHPDHARYNPARRSIVIGSAAVLATTALARAQGAPAEFDAAAYRGRVLYLDFWASWCGPCQQSFPYMAHLVASCDANKFALLAVNVDHDRASADAFLRRFNARVPVIYDPNGAIAARYRIRAMPTSLLLGRDGRVRYVHDGFVADQIATYDNQIAELLHET